MIHVEKHGPVVGIRMARAFLGRPIYWTTAYWVDGLLVDTGPRCTATELVKLLDSVHVDQVVVTHSHEDHTGGLAALIEHYPDVDVYASTPALPILERPSRLHMQLYRRLVWGTPEPVRGVMSLDAVENCIETPSYRFRVIETPGHTRDHISLFEPDHRWLFSGDAYIGGREQAWTPESDMFGIISSLRTLASLRPERLFPSLAHQVAEMEEMGLTVPDMVSRLFQEEPRLHFWTRGHFSAAHLIEACREYNAIFALGNQGHEPSSSATDSQMNPSTGPSGSKSSDSSAENRRGR
jgi:glyoxylase-like metal-dependent hydrolase (beta-lactamase superfamily II)